MHLPVNRPNRLPKRFPVGTKFVVEGFGGDEGALRVVSRYLILPNGRRVNVPAHSSQPASSRLSARRRSPKLMRSKAKMRSAGNRKKIAGGPGTRCR